MPRRSSVSGSDREFFALAAEAAFRNPFADGYEELLRKLTGRNPRADLRGAAGEAVRRRVEQLDTAGLGHLQAWRQELREEMRLVFLFEVYRRFESQFDALIAAQIAAGETAMPVDFAPEVLALLHRRGLHAAEALRLFAMLFQIRRAAYFIEHGLIGGSACMRELRRHLWENVLRTTFGGTSSTCGIAWRTFRCCCSEKPGPARARPRRRWGARGSFPSMKGAARLRRALPAAL